MPTAPSQVDMITDSRRIRFTLMPAALANCGLEPTAVMAVPVFVRKNAQIPRARTAKNKMLPVGKYRPSSGSMGMARKLASALS